MRAHATHAHRAHQTSNKVEVRDIEDHSATTMTSTLRMRLSSLTQAYAQRTVCSACCAATWCGSIF